VDKDARLRAHSLRRQQGDDSLVHDEKLRYRNLALGRRGSIGDAYQ
jgi:hypothetical protein